MSIDPFTKISSLTECQPEIRHVAGVPRLHYKHISSTHTVVIDQVDNFLPLLAAGNKCVALTADRQTNGVGSFVNSARRKWEDANPAINVKLTILHTVSGDPDRGILATFATIACQLVNKIFEKHSSTTRAEIKWQNDITIDGLKLGGVLAEKLNATRDDLYVLSIGLNIKQGTDLSSATHLSAYLDLSDEELFAIREQFIDDMICAIAFNWPSAEQAQADLSKLLAFKNRKVKVYTDRGDTSKYSVHYLKDASITDGKILTEDGLLYCESLALAA